MEIDFLKVKEVFLSEKYKTFFELVKMAKKHSNKTDLNTLAITAKKQNIDPPSQEFIRECFKLLENFKFGNLTRYDYRYQFDWQKGYSMISFKNILCDEPIKIIKIKDNISDENYQEESDPVKNSDPIIHEFMLRPDFKIGLSLPKDFTLFEADRLNSYIKTLPFGG